MKLPSGKIPSRLLPLCFFMATGFIVYAGILAAFFQTDSFRLVGQMEPRGPFQIWWLFDFFRPLCSLSLYADYRISGLSPIGYHVSSVLIHALNAWLVYILSALLLRRLPAWRDRAPWIAFCTGLLFLVHPSHFKAVAWIVNRSCLLATLFMLSSFVTYISALEKGRPFLLPISCLLYLGALFSKESAFAFPAIILLYEIYRHLAEGRKAEALKKGVLRGALFVLLTLPYPLLRYLAMGDFIGGNALSYMHLEPSALSVHLYKAFFRSLLPPMPSGAVFDFVSIGILAAGLAAVLWPLIRERRGFPGLGLFLIGAFLLSLFPTAGMHETLPLLKVNDARERFLYFPSVFTLILVMMLVMHVFRNRAAFVMVSLILFVPSLLSLHGRMDRWNQQAAGSKAMLECLKAEIRSDPEWRDPGTLPGILHRCYKKVAPQGRVGMEVFKRIKTEFDLYEIIPPVWLKDADPLLEEAFKGR